MHLIHVTDTHIAHQSPRKLRGVGYEDDVFAKLDFVRLVARSYSDAVIVHTGDAFERPVEPLSTTIRYANWALSFGDTPFIQVVGQHDLRGYQRSTLPECSLGVLQCASGALAETHVLGGIDPDHDWRVESLDCTYEDLLAESAPAVLEGVDIVATHLSIHPNSYGCTHPNAVLWPKVKLVLCAHIHQGFPAMKNRQGTWFSAPGALVRLNADEVDREPQISVIELQGGEVKSVEYLPVPCRPAPLVFDLGAMVEIKEQAVERNRFMETIDSIGDISKIGDWRAILAGLGDQVEPEVLARVTGYCERA
ncbi:MAG: metallophosphoesterase [Armatimonadota bacterium]